MFRRSRAHAAHDYSGSPANVVIVAITSYLRMINWTRHRENEWNEKSQIKRKRTKWILSIKWTKSNESTFNKSNIDVNAKMNQRMRQREMFRRRRESKMPKSGAQTKWTSQKHWRFSPFFLCSFCRFFFRLHFVKFHSFVAPFVFHFLRSFPIAGFCHKTTFPSFARFLFSLHFLLLVRFETN